MKRSILSTLIFALVVLLQACAPSQAASVISEPPESSPALTSCETIVYGHSGSGRYDLTAYHLGSGENTLLLTFCLHGWDDGFPGDGQALAAAGDALVQWLQGRPELAEGWSIYVIPRANPDGLNEGWSNYGPGRCTTWLFEGGQSVDGHGVGIDLNRSFPYCFSPMSDSRNFNGEEPLQCAEALALAEFTESIQEQGQNLLIDVHGWEEGLFLSNPGSPIEAAVAGVFPSCVPGGTGRSLKMGYGYFSAWAGYELGWDSALLELPASITSEADFTQAQISNRLCQMVAAILTAGKEELP